MGSVLQQAFKNLGHSLETRTLGRCSRWAEKVRYMSRPEGTWSFYYHPWLRELHDDNSALIAIQKAAQVGFTEYAINRSLYTIDQRKINVLYALPNAHPDAGNFSRTRINEAEELSPYLGELFQKGKSESLKISNSHVNLYIRGSRSRACFKNIDVGLIVLDELDEMTDEAIGLAEHRKDGQIDHDDSGHTGQLIMLSTPSIEGVGINRQYQDSTQGHFEFKCPHCGKYLRLEFPRNIEIIGEDPSDPRIAESFYKCHLCDHKLEHEQKPHFLKDGIWVHDYPTSIITGYHINQMYSYASGGTPESFARYSIKAQYNISDNIEFHNSSLGACFEEKGAKITDSLIRDAQGDFKNGIVTNRKDKAVTIGLDIGAKKHHYVVCGWSFPKELRDLKDINKSSFCTVLEFGTVTDMDEFEKVMGKWAPKKIVIDAQPEVGMVRTFCTKWKGLVYANYYTTSKEMMTIKNDTNRVDTSRTYWLDLVFDHFNRGTVRLPMDVNNEFKLHLKALVRVTQRNKKDELVSDYKKKEKEGDHYCHALNYAGISLGLLAGGGGVIHS